MSAFSSEENAKTDLLATLVLSMRPRLQKLLKFAGCGAASFCALAVWAAWPVEIEGSWSGYATKCLCESYNFLLIEDGDISQYSDTHSSKLNIGKYSRIGGGKYQVTIFEVERESFVIGGENLVDPEKSWEVSPRRLFLYHPLIDDIPKALMPESNYLFPVPPWKKAREITRSAPDRDAENLRRQAEYETAERNSPD